MWGGGRCAAFSIHLEGFELIIYLMALSMADLIERNALVNAQANAAQVEMLVGQAIRACPRVQPIGQVDIVQGSVAFSFI